MSDLISRSKIYKYIKTEINPYGRPFEGTTYEFGLKLMEYIENMTPVEEKEVVHGEWKKVGSGSLYDTYECTNCHCPPKWDCLGDNRWKIAFTDFCPNCGADMRKEV